MKTKNYILMLGVSGLLQGGLVFADTTDANDRAMLKGNLRTNEDPTNTQNNERDRNENSVLPENQSNQKIYIERTAAIRSEIQKINNASTNAKNIKIITLDDGTTILRGPVQNTSEKTQIEAIARKHSGNGTVKSFLETEQ